MEKIKHKTHRFKFSDNFSEIIEEFTRIHKFDQIKHFKEAWDEWKGKNEDIITKEYRYLSNKGYDGNIYDKIYKSIRYYHKNKTVKEKTKIQRKKYVGLDRTILELMDSHISKQLKMETSKPSLDFIDFMNTLEKNTLDNQVMELSQNGYNNEHDILNKFKKTYKNRYFIKQKK